MINGVPDTDIDELMRRLHTEADSYRHSRFAGPDRPDEFSGKTDESPAIRRGQELAVPAAIHLTLPEPDEPIAMPAFIDGNCTLDTLLAYQDRAFVHAVYWGVLRRAPD